MNEDLYIEYIQKDLLGTLTDSEKSQLETWKQKNEENKMLSDNLYKAWEMSSAYGEDIIMDTEKDFLKVKEKIWESEQKSIFLGPGLWMGAAATFILIVSAFFLLRQPQEVKILAATDRYEVNLPDGSSLLLSEGSRISYTSNFEKKRSILMQGEAFLDIVHDQKRPFEVRSPHLMTKVLGTSFFLRDDVLNGEAEIQLLNGRVSVTHKETGQTELLESNQRIRLADDQLIKYDRLSTKDFNWYYDTIRFEQIKMEEVIRSLETHFGVSIDLNDDLKRCSFTGNFTDQTIEEILESVAILFEAKLIKNEVQFAILDGQCN